MEMPSAIPGAGLLYCDGQSRDDDVIPTEKS